MAKKLNDEGGGSNTVTPDEFLGFVSEIESAQRKIDEITAERRSAVGTLRSIRKRVVGRGTNMEALDQILAERKMDDDDRAALLSSTARYRKWLSMPLGFEPDMLDEIEQPSEKAVVKFSEARAESDGYNSRLVGADTRDRNPHKAGTLEHQRWEIGWIRCDHDRTDAPKDGVTKASTAPRPGRGRGRPPKAEPAPAPADGAGSDPVF